VVATRPERLPEAAGDQRGGERGQGGGTYDAHASNSTMIIMHMHQTPRSDPIRQDQLQRLRRLRVELELHVAKPAAGNEHTVAEPDLEAQLVAIARQEVEL